MGNDTDNENRILLPENIFVRFAELTTTDDSDVENHLLI